MLSFPLRSRWFRLTCSLFWRCAAALHDGQTVPARIRGEA